VRSGGAVVGAGAVVDVGVGTDGSGVDTDVAVCGVSAVAGGAVGDGGAAGGCAAGGSGEVSTRAESEMSDDAFRNSRMLFPRAAPTSGSRPGPMITKAMTRMTMSSNGPMFGMSLLVSTSYPATLPGGRARWLG
jgi:hypothetical protein